MSDTWNQQPQNQQPQNQNPLPNPKTGGLLSNYQSQAGIPPEPNNALSANQFNQSNAGIPPTPPAQPGSQYSQSSPLDNYTYTSQTSQTPLALPPMTNAPHGTPHGFQPMLNGPAQTFSHAMDIVRQWSGKMAAAVGYPHPQPQPSAPQMMRHQSTPPSYAPGMGLAGVGSATPDPPHRSIAIRIAWQKRQRRNKKNTLNRVMMSVSIALLVIVLLTGFAGTAYGYSFYEQQLPLMQKYANKQISQNTRIYDRNGVLLYEAYNQSSENQQGRRVAVRYEDIPEVMQDAMISIEDKTFWTNEGVDLNAIIRAASSSNGGASTLTQQLIKNLSGNNQYTYTRKLQEAAMAIGLTQNYSKAKILEMYFNIAPFGANTYGIEVAAEDLFGLKPVCNVGQACEPGISKLEYNQQTKKNDPILALARASLLAGIPNNPSLYDPTLGPTQTQSLLDRQKLVLTDMIDQGRLLDGKPITEAMAQQAEALSVKMTFKPYQGIKRAPNFVDYVVQQVEAALGNGNAQAGVYAFLTGGYNIRTTIDVNLVDYTQNAIKRHLYQPEVQKALNYTATLNVDNNVNNAAVVVLDSKSGEVLAMNGSVNYNSTDPKVAGQYNAAVGTRPPGSTFKPFDYATAFQMGWTPGIILQDTRTYFPNGAAAGIPVYTSNDATSNQMNADEGIYSPSDYGQRYWEKPYSIRLATQNSFNISAIRAMQYAGQQAVLDTTRRLGITSLKAEGLSMAIGSQDVSPLQMASAYQTFADGGKHIPPQIILDIWDNYGHSLYHYDENNPPATRVFSPEVSYMMTSVLIDEPSRDFEFHNDHDLSLSDIDPTCMYEKICGHQMAAKTGTTDSFADNWTIGYTPDVTVAVWAGNSDDSPMNNVIGITGAAPIFHSVVERVLDHCNYSVPIINDASYSDGVPCGPDYHFRFSNGHEQWTFPTPAGLTQSAPAGLSADSAEVDWMLQQ